MKTTVTVYIENGASEREMEVGILDLGKLVKRYNMECVGGQGDTPPNYSYLSFEGTKGKYRCWFGLGENTTILNWYFNDILRLPIS